MQRKEKNISVNATLRDPKIDKVAENLYLITLYPPIRGFEEFITTWLYTKDINFIVDVGPSVTSAGLIQALHNLGITSLDYILLTHIHIDHAGGVGEVSEYFSDTPIVCHKVGIPHLVDPARLWKGTVKTLGDTAKAYGPFMPVPFERLLDAEVFSSHQIHPVFTPGHAAHHISYMCEPFLFAGEAGGVFLKTDRHGEYLRPATPPRFFFETFVQSLDKLIEKSPDTICYGHCGIKSGAKDMLKKHKQQLYLWLKIIKEEIGRFREKDFIADCRDRLLNEDVLLKEFFHMMPSVQKRERQFLSNSIKGFVGYLEDL